MIIFTLELLTVHNGICSWLQQWTQHYTSTNPYKYNDYSYYHYYHYCYYCYPNFSALLYLLQLPQPGLPQQQCRYNEERTFLWAGR